MRSFIIMFIMKSMLKWCVDHLLIMGSNVDLMDNVEQINMILWYTM